MSSYVVAIVTCLGREVLRTVVRTEPEWTFGDLYAYTSRRQTICAKMFEAVHITIVTQLRGTFKTSGRSG